MSLFFVLVCRILPSCTSKTFLVCSLWFAGNNVPVSQITKQHLWLGIERKWLWRLRITEFQQNRSCCVHGIKFCWVNLKSPSLPDTQNWSFVVLLCSLPHLFKAEEKSQDPCVRILLIPWHSWWENLEWWLWSKPCWRSCSLHPPITAWVTVASGALGKWCTRIPGVKVEPWMQKLLHFFGNTYCHAKVDGHSVNNNTNNWKHQNDKLFVPGSVADGK